jgi:hypothetical protein
VGNRLTKLEGGVTVSYSYDEGDRLTVKWNPTVRVTYSYDANGNTTVEDNDRALTSYSWDIENRVTQVALLAGTLNTMTYYGDGKRCRYQDNTGALDRTFLWDGQNIVRQVGSNGATNRNYTLKPAGFGELVSQDAGGAGTAHFHHFDGLGGYLAFGDRHGGLRSRPSHSTDRLTDASQAEQVHYLYRAFGEQSVHRRGEAAGLIAAGTEVAQSSHGGASTRGGPKCYCGLLQCIRGQQIPGIAQHRGSESRDRR